MMTHRFNPHHAHRLLSEERMQLIPPSKVIEHLQIEAGHKVADVGAGPGYFAIPVARHTGSLVYGIDVEPQMLSMLTERAEQAQVTLQAVHASAERIPLSEGLVDRTLCAFVLHEVDNPSLALQEFRRITTNEGLIGIVEWEKKVTKHGPPVQERLSREELMKELGKAKLKPQKWVELNEDQYLCICSSN